MVCGALGRRGASASWWRDPGPHRRWKPDRLLPRRPWAGTPYRQPTIRISSTSKEHMMRRHILYRSFLTGLLVLSLTLPGYAEKTEQRSSQGIVLTVVALDPKTHIATLRADNGGKEFQVTNSASWKTGSKVLCDLVEEVSPGPQLQHCQQ